MEASEKMREATKAVSRMEDAEKVLREYNYDKTKLVPILQAAQARYNWLSKELLSYIACALGLPPARVYGVATFYAHFSLKPKGKNIIRLCDGTACHIKGSPLIQQWITAELGIKDGETDKEGRFSLQTVACLGCCSLAPVMSVNGRVYGKLDRKSTIKILKEYEAK